MPGRHRKPPPRRGGGRHRQPPPRHRLAIPAIAAVVVIGAGGVGAAAAFTGGSEHPQPRAVATIGQLGPTDAAGPLGSASPAAPAPKVGDPAPATGASPTSGAITLSPVVVSPGAAPTRPRHGSVALGLTVTGRVSWVQVTRGSHVLFQGMLRHGHRLTYPHGPLQVTLGDAGAVRLQLGRHVTDPAGRSGQVLRFTVR
ncbi:MAG TPA: RodZ domain-containing protein [Mycobacteriales bacterium]|nr:RodZ domain-containing protein [Mycobacteriales bacterium]